MLITDEITSIEQRHTLYYIVVVDVYHQPSTAAPKQKNPAPMTKATNAGCVC